MDVTAGRDSFFDIVNQARTRRGPNWQPPLLTRLPLIVAPAAGPLPSAVARSLASLFYCVSSLLSRPLAEEPERGAHGAGEGLVARQPAGEPPLFCISLSALPPYTKWGGVREIELGWPGGGADLSLSLPAAAHPPSSPPPPLRTQLGGGRRLPLPMGSPGGGRRQRRRRLGRPQRPRRRRPRGATAGLWARPSPAAVGGASTLGRRAAPSSSRSVAAAAAARRPLFARQRTLASVCFSLGSRLKLAPVSPLFPALPLLPPFSSPQGLCPGVPPPTQSPT